MDAILTGQILAIPDLNPERIAEMFSLFSVYYHGTSLGIFQRDLGKKNWVILLFDTQEGKLRGFTTFEIYTRSYQGSDLTVVYSGDTVVEKEYRGNFDLPRIWIHSILDVCVGMPRPIYWLLISSGYKTYRFLPLFYKQFYPRSGVTTPEDTQQMIDFLANDRFGTEYDPRQGIVQFHTGATPLRQGVAEITARHLQDPNIVFFVQRNPGHSVGDELVCLTEIDPRNFTDLGALMAS